VNCHPRDILEWLAELEHELINASKAESSPMGKAMLRDHAHGVGFAHMRILKKLGERL
jgi:hypothetical protein